MYDSFEGEKTEENSHDSYNNQLLVEIVQADEEYILTVIADDEFLNAPDTVYPVYVDPSMTVMGNGDIADAAIYSKINYNLSATEQQQIKIGCDSFYGIGRGLYNFPIMDFNLDFVFLYGNQISSATLNLYYLSNTSNDSYSTLSLYEFGSSWSEGTVKWNNTSPYNYNRFISAQSIGGGSGYKSFDISYVTNQFKTDPDYTTAFKGLMLKADNESGTWKKFVSSEGASNRQPYIQITYNDQPTACAQVTSGAVYYIKNYNSEYLDISNSGTQAITYPFHGATNQQFKIVNVTGAEYEIYPMFNTGKVLSSNGSSVYIDTDCNLSNQRWYIFYRNGSYHFVNKAHLTKLLEQSYDAVDREVTLGNRYDYCCWELESTDPLHSVNIEYVRYTKIPSSDTSHLLSVIKSRLYSDDLFVVTNQSNNATKHYIIDQSLKNQLNGLESSYHSHMWPSTEENAAHAAKEETDQLVTAGYIQNASSEYYGSWASNYEYLLDLLNYWKGVINKASAAYGVYLAVTSYYYSALASGSTTTVNASQYSKMSGYIDDIDKAMSGIGYSNRTIISAEERNSVLSSVYSNPPYKSGTPVIGFKTTQSTGNLYIKVSANNNINSGGFVAKADDILGLTPAQINSKFALGYEPQYYCYVNINSGTQMYTGIVGPNYGLPGGGIQYDIFGQLENVTFGPTYPLL